MSQANQEIESVKAALSVVIDDGDFIINSTGPMGKAMAQSVLSHAAGARKVTIIQDGEMKVMKRGAVQTGVVQTQAAEKSDPLVSPRRQPPATPVPATPAGPDVQDTFVADLESGATGESAMGETPTPTPGPSDPVAIPAGKPAASARRKPQIFQDAAAPPAPELAQAEMDQLLAEAAQAEKDAAKAAEDRRFQQQQAIQSGQEPAIDPAEPKPTPRKREPRQLATTGRPCGRCAGSGQIVGEAGFQGACPVCHGEGQVKTWDRSLKVR